MKASKKDILLLVGLIGILAAVCSYFLVYQPTMEAAEALEQENLDLQVRINDLSSKMENKDNYIEETARMHQEMEAIFDRFPVDVREEDGILLAINQELAAPMMINSVGIGACEPVVLNTDGEDYDNIYEINVPSILMGRNLTMNYLVSYDGLKRALKNISVQDNRMSIRSLTISYDESTGLLSGTTIVDMYCIPGQPGKEYEEPNFSFVLLGSDNIFGSLELDDGGFTLINVDEEGTEGAEGEDAAAE